MKRLSFLLLGIAAGLAVAAAFVALAPVSWDEKNAHANCKAAIGGSVAWPSRPEKACAAMHLCINEADLSEAQSQKLMAAIRGVPGCQEP